VAQTNNRPILARIMPLVASAIIALELRHDTPSKARMSLA
jgi:hypothetical protein